MLSITIELNKDMRIGYGTIVNMNITSDPSVGNYSGIFYVTDINGDTIIYETEIENFDRSKDAWTLIYEMLKKVNEG